MEAFPSYDERQYRLMLGRLDAYQRGQIGLSPLITDLEALCDALQNTTADWRQDFWQKWGKLEDVYAIALDEGRSELEPTEEVVVNQVINNLRDQIQHKLESMQN